MHCKGSSRENTISRYGHVQGGGGQDKYNKYYGRPMRGPPGGMGRYDEEAPPPMHMDRMGPPPMGPPLLPPMNAAPMMMGPPPPLSPPPMVPMTGPMGHGPPGGPPGGPDNNHGPPPGPPGRPGPGGGPPGADGPPGPPPPNPECDMKDLNKMFGMTASDIDKYSRVFFPVTFTCFQLMYWIIYQHLSDFVIDDLVYLQKD